MIKLSTKEKLKQKTWINDENNVLRNVRYKLSRNVCNNVRADVWDNVWDNVRADVLRNVWYNARDNIWINLTIYTELI
jgi:hypothetical protein